MGGLTDLEQRVVDLIDDGLTRWMIADELALGETTVRGVIERLCDRYDCRSRDLPEAVKGEKR